MSISLVTDLETGNSTGQDLVDDLESNAVITEAAINWITSVDEGVTATGTNHATGYDITKANTRFTTVTGAAYAAALPELSTISPGKSFKIFNDDSADNLSVFPEASDNAGNGVGSAVVIYPGCFAIFFALDSTNWKVLHGRPSVQSEYTADGTLKEFEMVNGSTVHLSLAGGLSLAMPASFDDMKYIVRNWAGTNTMKPNGSEVINLDGTPLTAGNKVSMTAGTVITVSKRAATSEIVVSSDGGASDGGA